MQSPWNHGTALPVYLSGFKNWLIMLLEWISYFLIASAIGHIHSERDKLVHESLLLLHVMKKMKLIHAVTPCFFKKSVPKLSSLWFIHLNVCMHKLIQCHPCLPHVRPIFSFFVWWPKLYLLKGTNYEVRGYVLLGIKTLSHFLIRITLLSGLIETVKLIGFNASSIISDKDWLNQTTNPCPHGW